MDPEPFEVGTRVRHPQYGLGVVIRVSERPLSDPLGLLRIVLFDATVRHGGTPCDYTDLVGSTDPVPADVALWRTCRDMLRDSDRETAGEAGASNLPDYLEAIRGLVGCPTCDGVSSWTPCPGCDRIPS